MPAASLHLDLRAAFRQRLLGVTLADTGTTTLGASGSTFTRAAGSFVADGFAPGDEVMASGFAGGADGRATVVSVSASSLVVDRALATNAAAAGRRLLAGLPQGRAWEGTEFLPQTGQPWLRESFRPLSSEVRSLGVGGTIAHTMTGNLSLFYPSRRGTLAVERMAGAVVDLFAPGTALTYGGNSGVVLRCERQPLVQEPDWVSAPVIVSVTAYTLR